MAVSDVKVGAQKRRKDMWDNLGEAAKLAQTAASLYSTFGTGTPSAGSEATLDTIDTIELPAQYDPKTDTMLASNQAGYSNAMLRRLRNQRSV